MCVEGYNFSEIPKKKNGKREAEKVKGVSREMDKGRGWVIEESRNGWIGGESVLFDYIFFSVFFLLLLNV